ncbi:MAG: hypothetical protein HQL34_01170 [Alphaproteobacteria bacterium]|nr:hypothetical protein [Alphaproteobacteria bacterium]
MSEILFEMMRVGNAVRVTAIDPATGTEVVLVGSAQASPYTLKANAARKLQAVIAKKKLEKG